MIFFRVAGILILLELMVHSGLYQAQKFILWRRATSPNIHSLLSAAKKAPVRQSAAGIYEYLIFFDYLNPFESEVEVVFNVSDRLEKLTFLLKTYDPAFFEVIPGDENRKDFPMREFTRLAGEAIYPSAVQPAFYFERVLAKNLTFTRLRGYSLPSKQAFEIDIMRENLKWRVARWRTVDANGAGTWR